MSRSAAYRIAETLKEWGFLESDPLSGRWRLGVEAKRIGLVALRSTDIMQIAPRMLRALVEQTRESCNLAVFDSGSMVIVYRQESDRSVHDERETRVALATPRNWSRQGLFGGTSEEGSSSSN